jgi:hypothetical protein
MELQKKEPHPVLSPAREGVVVTMLSRPVLHGGMGLDCQEAAASQIRESAREICDSLIAAGVTPDHVGFEVLEMLLCHELFVLCGTSAAQAPGPSHMQRLADPSRECQTPTFLATGRKS